MIDSLKTIFDSLESPNAAEAEARAVLLRRIEAGPVLPWVFGAYVDLVLALFAERDDDAGAILDELLNSKPTAPDALRIVTLDAELSEGQSARYRRLLSDDIACELEPLRREASAHAESRLAAALGLLRSGAPDLFGEFRALVREIVLVRPAGGQADFGGASTFSLWGALVLNAEAFGDRLDVAVSLAHEAAHGLLFGLALGGRLVENDDAERYPSPLRRDLRPMEGVAHATYVTARMAYALRTLIDSGRLNGPEMKRAVDQLVHNEQIYRSGIATVSAHARFTPVGAAAFEALRNAMGGR